MPPYVPKVCVHCGRTNTWTHYEHIDLAHGIIHQWDETPSPLVDSALFGMPRPTGIPQPQPCPNGDAASCAAKYTKCYDCGWREDY